MVTKKHKILSYFTLYNTFLLKKRIIINIYVCDFNSLCLQNCLALQPTIMQNTLHLMLSFDHLKNSHYFDVITAC